MVVDQIFSASRFGLEYERLRLEAASHNIAVANTPVAPGQPTRLLRAAPYGVGFDAVVGIGAGELPPEPALVAVEAGQREVHDPSDPMADAQGMVSYPRVDMVQEMSSLVEASRAYEANVRAFNTLRSMALHALDVGGES